MIFKLKSDPQCLYLWRYAVPPVLAVTINIESEEITEHDNLGLSEIADLSAIVICADYLHDAMEKVRQSMDIMLVTDIELKMN